MTLHLSRFRSLVANTFIGLAFLSAGLLAQGGPPANGAGAGGAAAAPGQGRQAGPAATPDPRVGLKPGYRDAGTASKGMELVASLPKPDGFFDPSGPFAFFNSDIAFRGNLLALGNFHGVNFYDIADPTKVKLQASMPCPGGQGDVSIYGKLLFMSVEETVGRIDCGVPPTPPPAAPGAPRGGGRGTTPPDPLRFRGVRIFDISDVTKPKQIAAVQTCRGSHTHTLVTDPKDKANIYIYGSGTAGVRSPEELAGCFGDAADANTALFSIDVIKVPLATPERAAVVNRPRVFADANTGAPSGLWQGGTHGAGTQTSGMTTACHDITVYPEMGLAAGACGGNGILLDISDPVHPIRIDDVADPGFAYWHSAAFNNDATKVIYTDEWGGGTSPRCRATDPLNWGADAIFTLANKRLKFASYYKMPAAQTDTENCVAHNGSLVPVPGRDIKIQAWYQGGASMVDFTDAAHPVELAYFDRGPIDPAKLLVGGFWSVYWYNGYLYGSEIYRGIDVFKLVPTDLLSQNEIDAANTVKFDQLNVQSQPHITWTPSTVVARAYIDQLTRVPAAAPAGRAGGQPAALAADKAAALTVALKDVDGATGAGRSTAIAKLAPMAAQLEKDATTAKPIDAKRMKELASTLKKLK